MAAAAARRELARDFGSPPLRHQSGVRGGSTPGGTAWMSNSQLGISLWKVTAARPRSFESLVG